MKTSWNTITTILKKGGVAILPTDTLYGIVGIASNKKTVERIYKIKGRDNGKPCIILITTMDQLKNFGITLGPNTEEYRFLRHVWPGKVSVVLPCMKPSLKYLHRGTNALAFRMVSAKNRNLFTLIESVGPLVAPSANPEGMKPAENSKEAQSYFGKSVDAYTGGPTKDTRASTLVSLLGPKPKILRQGSVDIYSYTKK